MARPTFLIDLCFPERDSFHHANDDKHEAPDSRGFNLRPLPCVNKLGSGFWPSQRHHHHRAAIYPANVSDKIQDA
jgi:hypothetical protein